MAIAPVANVRRALPPSLAVHAQARRAAPPLPGSPRHLLMSIVGLFHRAAIVDADLIPVSPSLPVLEAGIYVWPVGRVLLGEVQPTGSRFYTEGDCTTCPRCGIGNSTIAPYCARCRALLPLGSTTPEGIDDEALLHELRAPGRRATARAS